MQQRFALSEIGELPSEARGREELAEFFERVREAMGELARLHSAETVVAVTHAGFIMASIRVLFDIPTPGSRARFDPALASLTEWTWVDGTWRLERYNVAASWPAA